MNRNRCVPQEKQEAKSNEPRDTIKNEIGFICLRNTQSNFSILMTSQLAMFG